MSGDVRKRALCGLRMGNVSVQVRIPEMAIETRAEGRVQPCRGNTARALERSRHSPEPVLERFERKRIEWWAPRCVMESVVADIG